MVKKYTNKLKQSGSGFRIRSRLRNLFGRKKTETQAPKTIQKKQIPKPRNPNNEKPGLLDELFYKLCNKKMERYEKNRDQEKKGLLYAACYKIGKEKFDNLDKKINKNIDNQFDQYVHAQQSITRNRPFDVQDLSTDEIELFTGIDTLLKKIDDIEEKMYTDVFIPGRILSNNTATAYEKDRVKQSIRKNLTDYESKIKSIRSDIHDLYLRTKILIDPKTLTHFNVQYNHLIKRFKDVFLLIKNYNQRTDLNLGDFTLSNNNIILNTSGKRLFSPSNKKIRQEKSIVEKLYDTLKMQDFAIRHIENEYNTKVRAELTKNKNHTHPEIKMLVDRFIDQLKYMKKEFGYITSKYKQLSNEHNTYKNNLSNLKSLKELYTSVYKKFKILFNKILTENKRELDNNTGTVSVSPL
jgi:hypothetical protein